MNGEDEVVLTERIAVSQVTGEDHLRKPVPDTFIKPVFSDDMWKGQPGLLSGANLAFFKKQNGYALFSKVNRTSEPCRPSTDDDDIERLIGIRDSDNKILSSSLREKAI